jgi:hypothetical protein
MDCTDIHYCDSSTYDFALALYKNQFAEIWHHEKINLIKELRVFGRRIMLKNMIIPLIIIFLAVELIEHIIFPIIMILTPTGSSM